MNRGKIQMFFREPPITGCGRVDGLGKTRAVAFSPTKEAGWGCPEVLFKTCDKRDLLGQVINGQHLKSVRRGKQRPKPSSSKDDRKWTLPFRADGTPVGP